MFEHDRLQRQVGMRQDLVTSLAQSREQARIEGEYPDEISGLTDNLNTLIQQERVRQTVSGSDEFSRLYMVGLITGRAASLSS